MNLPTTLAFVSAQEDISYNGNMTSQHPINESELGCYLGTDYTNYCSREDFNNFDWRGFLKNHDKFKLIHKDDYVFMYKTNNAIAALCPIE